MPFRGVPFLQPRESWYMPRPLLSDKPGALGESDCESLRTSGGFMVMSDFHGTWSLFDHKGITWESLGEAWLPRASTRVASLIHGFLEPCGKPNYTKPFASILQLPNVNIWGYQKTRHPKGGNLFYYRVHHNVVPLVVTWFYCPSSIVNIRRSQRQASERWQSAQEAHAGARWCDAEATAAGGGWRIS